MGLIVGIHGREVLDSRGTPAVEAEVWLDSGVTARAIVPSGASTGGFGAVGLRDGGDRYMGRGVLDAVRNVNDVLSPLLIGTEASDQFLVDGAMIDEDGRADKGRLGANAILAVSMAVARAAALEHDRPLWAWIGGMGPYSLPLPMMNVIDGGVHAADGLDIQEFMIVPHGASEFSEALRMGVEICHHLKGILRAGGHSTAVGDEGGFAPRLGSSRQALDLLVEAIVAAGYRPGDDVGLALGVAATELREGDRYRLRKEARSLSSSQLIDYYDELCRDYPLVSIEDGLAEEDWEGWAVATERLGSKVQLVGGDLFVTHPGRFRRGIDEGVANAVRVRPDQIGTVTETLQVIDMARRNGYGAVISHRSGETEDAFIADLAVGTGAGQIKAGAPARTDRVAKYNQLLRIAEELGGRAPFAGRTPFSRRS
ncbi:phosphopyruvate hydratase [Aminirod propionatiphilus]|uniref:Phosphopyruvate hydratase n=1 Tax=Aminirod propionatiphilus TaxID=3415223 RepID=A0ACD1DTI0_9BACT|nr:phosphopyruvate hydratase [Synergistota bacterium]